MRIHAPLLPLAGCLIAGIAVSQWVDEWQTGLIGLTICAAITALLRHRPRLQTIAICWCTLLLGIILGSRQRQQLDIEWPQQRQHVQLVIASEVKVKEKVVVFDALTATGHQKLRCNVRRDKQSERLQIGHGLQVYTRIKPIHEWNAGKFDHRQYMQCQGFTGELYAGDHQWQSAAVALTGLSKTARIRLHFMCWRHRILERLKLLEMDDDAYSLITAMTLGEKTTLSKDIKETYSRVGASHILALSGLHLMIIYSLITLVIGWHRYRIVTQVLTVLAIWAFALMTGLSISVVRSAFMITVYAVLSTGNRARMSVNTLAFVAIVLLAINPLTLYDLGFQLSFLAVLAILLIHPLINRLIAADVQEEHRWLSYVWGLITVSIAAQIGTAPLVAYQFGRFSTWFLLSNFIVVPLAWLILNLALLCVGFYWWTWAQKILATGLAWLATTMNHALAWVAQLPMSSIEGFHLSVAQVYLIYIIMVCCYVAVSLRYPAVRRSG